ncbi:hypothetical protein D9615_007663 [Tricholomella constricta]|uniref:Uncharacterized protein n=1 Tax=Tricholomella constricta TaxID=117010 RepID=A0A8H5M088_9AGAR|nr:hypothetical protein D9615_007663 [Tricholomella constricta]
MTTAALAAKWTAKAFEMRTPRHSSTPRVTKLNLRTGPYSRPENHDAPPDWHAPPALQEQMDKALAHAWKPSTSLGYSRSLDDFFRFCAGYRVPISACLPASEELLCAYAASHIGRLSGAAIRSKCSAVRAWHISNGLEWHGASRLSYTIKGCEDLRPPDSLKPKRNPVTVDMLSKLLEGLDLSSPLDVCVAFVATTSFWGQLRLGELLPISETNVNSPLPFRSDLREPNAKGSRCLHLPSTKTQTKGEDVVITRQHVADPIKHLLLHLTVNMPKSRDAPLCSYRSASGRRVMLCKRKFLIRCNEIFAARKLPRITGHCFRIGGTTHLLISGVPPDIVKVMGRWSSDAFLRYWRSLDLIAPLHAEFLLPLETRRKALRPSA